MTPAAPRSIDAYLKQLRDALADQDPALIQDAAYDAEEYLRAEIAAHPDKSEADVLELIASTYGAPEEVAAAYRETEAKVKAALQPPARPAVQAPSMLRSFFSVYRDPRAYTSLFVISLGEGRLIEAMTGERMPRRPVHPGPKLSLWAGIVAMLKDARTWTTLAYFILMLPLGIIYFVIATVGLAFGLTFTLAIPIEVLHHFDLIGASIQPAWLATAPMLIALNIIGIIVLTTLLHAARGIARAHARIAKRLLVTPG